MNKKLKRIYLVVTSVFLTLLSLPFSFAKSATGTKYSRPVSRVTTATAGSSSVSSTIKSVYDSLHLGISGLSREAFDYAKKGFDKLVEQGKIINRSVIAIADFSQPSTKKRLYVIDLRNYRLLFNTYVAHGRNSGLQEANSFSNEPSSYKSSPGFYVTSDTYNGKHGYSLRLEGIERGINNNAHDRAIVMHGADYVSQSFVNAQGYLGRSQGCPAVPVQEATPIINTLKGGSCLFIYSPDQNYISRSTVLS